MLWASVINICMTVSKFSHILATLQLGICAKYRSYISLQAKVAAKNTADSGKLKKRVWYTQNENRGFKMS
jgi:hypothetical protein